MSRCATLSPLSAEFNGFLFAAIHDELDKTPLSVISALARLNLDPWREAAELSALQGPAAIQRLSSHIDRLPEESRQGIDVGALCERLVLRLPPRQAIAAAPRQPVPIVKRVLASALGMNIVYCGLVVLSQFTIQAMMPSARIGPQNSAASHTRPFKIMPKKLPAVVSVNPEKIDLD